MEARKEGIQGKTQGKYGKGQKGTFLDIANQFREKRKNEEIRRARKSRE
ncbi:TPA: hypothetical protein HA351_09890 [Methanosarcinaceae archaeon]|nr:hypothetical protein [Methanosarcinaceae archaeon]